MADFPPDRYDDRGIYIPRLYGQPWQYWSRVHGLHGVSAIRAFVAANGIRMEGRDDDLLEWREVKNAGMEPAKAQP